MRETGCLGGPGGWSAHIGRPRLRHVCPPSSPPLTLVWILMLSFSSSRAVAAVRHHLVALEGHHCCRTNICQPDRISYESGPPRFGIRALLSASGTHCSPLGWGCPECPCPRRPPSSFSFPSVHGVPCSSDGPPVKEAGVSCCCSALGPGPLFPHLESGHALTRAKTYL